MHPVLARFLDPDAARDVLRRADDGEPVAAEDQPFVEAANAFANEKRTLLKAGRRLDHRAQQAVLFLATHAGLLALRKDAKLGPEIEQAEARLRELGAEPDDITAVLAQAVADEAFGTDQDPGEFDSEWFLESVRGLPRLLALEEDEVLALISKFANASPGESRMRDSVARSLLESAWSEGATPISVEHVEDALDAITEEFGAEGFSKGALVLAEFLERLRDEGLVGPLRSERLVRTARQAAAAGPEPEDEEEEDDENSDPEGSATGPA